MRHLYDLYVAVTIVICMAGLQPFESRMHAAAQSSFCQMDIQHGAQVSSAPMHHAAAGLASHPQAAQMQALRITYNNSSSAALDAQSDCHMQQQGHGTFCTQPMEGHTVPTCFKFDDGMPVAAAIIGMFDSDSITQESASGVLQPSGRVAAEPLAMTGKHAAMFSEPMQHSSSM